MIATRTAPGPRGKPLVGSLPGIRRDILGELSRAAQYGDVARLRVFNRSIYLLNHPDYVRHVLVENHRNYVKGRALNAAKAVVGDGLLTSEGEFHQRQRRLIQPAFHRQQIAHYADIMTAYTADHLAGWGERAALDLHHEMMTLTMAIVAKVLFDVDVRGKASAAGAALEGLFDDFSFMDSTPLGQWMGRLPLPRSRRRSAHIRTLDALIYDIIRRRRESGEEKQDALAMILGGVDPESGGMTDRQARDEVMTLFIAGHETTANALSWAMALLMEHPEVGAKLSEELDRVLQGRAPTMHDLLDLPYTKLIFSEALRLYPPAWVIGRTALHDDEIGGYVIPAGSTVLMSQVLLHRDPRFWSEPAAFQPERFASDAEAERPRYAYFPFGGGPRLCIGEPFAWMEGHLLLASVWQRYTLTLAEGARIEPEPLITLRLKHGLLVTAARR